MKKQCKVLLVPKDIPSKLYINNRGNLFITHKFEYLINENNQHLYLISNDEIKEGDWFINDHQASYYIDQKAAKESGRFADNSNNVFNKPRKIIASTQRLSPDFPDIPNTFLEKYIAEFNSRITSVKIKLITNDKIQLSAAKLVDITEYSISKY